MNRCYRECKGRVLQLQDYSISDGAGVRTVIFLAGCPMRCQWCGNPESQSPDADIFYFQHKCIDCRRCVKACPEGKDPRAHESCSMCGSCLEVCLPEALMPTSHEKTVEEVAEEIAKDSIFYMFSEGGVTFSGGEPFYQQDFLRGLTSVLENMGINMWVETCGQYSWSQVRDIALKMDHAFCDIKHMDSKVHKAYTSMGNQAVLTNVKRMYDEGIPVTVRIPLIKGFNAAEDNLRATAQFMRENIPCADIEILPYHRLGQGKYQALGREFIDFQRPDDEEIDEAYNIFDLHKIKRWRDL